ncbi:hypothetical protein ACFOLA_03735 [Salinicoccus hispanicus]|uniref:Uncharacterized protein n=1 Tax=Salinicoccus hispanicus TaxID=157225 RepID=A0A6N8U136_9STAP|nr:hypothetical protein [Salinicoccus hispanicus]MXQ51928.1 hypothetical protein [Salinicoccus hispanicus]
MFGIPDLISLIISAFIILPIVVILREVGYMIAGLIFGAENSRLTLGSGPRLFKLGKLDVRKHYHLYSWFSYDELKNDSRFAYIMIYASPILINVISGLIINGLLANDFMTEQATFWNRFIFYTFYYVLFDAVPMKTVNGMPNNGMLIYEMLRYGKRTDRNKEPFIPATSEVEKEYQEEMQDLEETVKEEKQEKKEEEEKKEKAREKKEEEREKRKQEERKS